MVDDPGAPDVAAAADELYGLPPGEFTAARDERAAQARRDGDRAAADALKKLRRPTSSAWAVNLLVRERRDELEQLLSLGDALREAQRSLAGDALRELSARRHQVVASLGHEARRLAYEAGHPVGDQVGREVEETLEAALADPRAAAAVRSGRLTGALSYAGIGEVDVSGAVALTVAPPARGGGRRGAAAPGGAKGGGADAAADRAAREREAAQAAVAAAEQVAERGRRALNECDASVRAAREDREAARERVSAAERELAAAQEAEATAARLLREAQRLRDMSAQELSEAERRLDRARDKVSRLAPPG